MKKIIYFWLMIAFVSCENVKQTYPQIESDWMDQQSFNELCEVITNNAKDYYKGIDGKDVHKCHMTSNMRWCYEYGYDGDIFIYDNNHHIGKTNLKIVADDMLKTFYKSNDFNFIDRVFVNGIGNIRIAIKNEYIIPTTDANIDVLQGYLFHTAVFKKYKVNQFEAIISKEPNSEEFKKEMIELIEIYGDDKYIVNIYPDTEESIIKEQLGIDIKKEKEIYKFFGSNVMVNVSDGFIIYYPERLIEEVRKLKNNENTNPKELEMSENILKMI